MDVKTIKTAVHSGLEVIKTNSHTIKSVAAMLGVGWMGYECYQAYPKAMELKENAEIEKGDKLTKPELVIAVAPAFIKPVAIGVGVETLIYSANKDASGKILAAGAVATMYKDQLKEFKDKVTELVGEKKVQEIKDEINKDTIMNHEHELREYTLSAKRPDGTAVVLMVDGLTGQPFYASMEQVRSWVKDMEIRLLKDDVVYMNEFYERAGIEFRNSSGIGVGSTAYFDSRTIQSLRNAFTFTVGEFDGQPCYVVNFDTEVMSFR